MGRRWCARNNRASREGRGQDQRRRDQHGSQCVGCRSVVLQIHTSKAVTIGKLNIKPWKGRLLASNASRPSIMESRSAALQRQRAKTNAPHRGTAPRNNYWPNS